jgi:anti-sigma28 factor (negative regulator of flagellin synthesis)
MVRIGGSGIDQLGGGSVGSVGGANSDSRSSATGASPKSDSVSLSNAANLIELAKAGAASRQSKVQSLGAEIKSGKYQADNAQISHAVVEGHISG